jgi:hypothetical protein
VNCSTVAVTIRTTPPETSVSPVGSRTPWEWSPP